MNAVPTASLDYTRITEAFTLQSITAVDLSVWMKIGNRKIFTLYPVFASPLFSISRPSLKSLSSVVIESSCTWSIIFNPFEDSTLNSLASQRKSKIINFRD